MKRVSVVVLSCVVAFASFLTACNKDDNNPPPAAMTLYDSLGGTTLVTDPVDASVKIEQGRLGIRSVVDSTIFVIAADPELNPYFSVLLAEVTAGDLSGFQELSKNLTDFFCVATGAKDYTYTGLSMIEAHDPAKNPRMAAKAADDDFDQFIVDLVAGATKNGLPDYLIARVGAIVETLRTQVVQM
ncbi:group 1 truncated hemoglobin [Panacibacter ginsenosidivorans]|uniref:Group 1 truncated hemoglobin n=1 Tax=Panacibacter ginsenosidivorans TaxID=1813871 RepID=A0A5B8VED1_9BACT|nr:group 1 truncated hemoglobin [Panacibacter ginsenosidivorans]QEC69682.1 group 1 truncated hemoglobin [Panacibacter ginsenosidivorans]